MQDAVRRGVGVVVLAALFVGLMVHYGAGVPQQELTRQSVVKVQSPADHVGADVHVWGTVLDNDERLVVQVGDSAVTVVGTETTADPGDAIQVYGTIQPDGSLAAERVVVSEQSGLFGLYAISAVALVLTLVVFFRSWRLDVRSVAFTPREEEGADDA
jgi:hypothetical protein